jgi:hypothetical protein
MLFKIMTDKKPLSVKRDVCRRVPCISAELLLAAQSIQQMTTFDALVEGLNQVLLNSLTGVLFNNNKNNVKHKSQKADRPTDVTDPFCYWPVVRQNLDKPHIK